MPSQVFKSKRHDTAIALPMTFTPPAGLNWNLQTAGVTMRFIARLPNATSPKVVSTEVTATAPWACQFAPVAADVDTIGSYDVEVEVTNSSGKKLTLPTEGWLSWVINPDLDNS